MTDAPSAASSLNDVATPALVLDRARLTANCAAMADRAHELGVRLRPHIKTAKSVDVARLATAGHFGGITVSTLREAEHFAAHGFTDLVYAVCISPAKLPRAAEIVRAGARLGLLTDDIGVARSLARFAADHGVSLDVLVEIDVGEHRTGVEPDSDALLAIAQTIHDADGLTLRGVLAHGGHAYNHADDATIAAIAEDERQLTVRAAERLRAAGLPCDDVSVGSTPTATRAVSGEGLTELRPGVYVFGDLFQAAVGSCRPDDLALSVLATVIAQRPASGALVLDAGALALSADRSTRHTAHDAGFGQLTDLHGRPLAGADGGAVHVHGVHQEHGEVSGLSAQQLAELPVGSRVRVLPNHACMTAAAYERYHVVEGSSPAVLAAWERVNGW